jgi:hypothetical protein
VREGSDVICKARRINPAARYGLKCCELFTILLPLLHPSRGRFPDICKTSVGWPRCAMVGIKQPSNPSIGKEGYRRRLAFPSLSRMHLRV